MTKATHTPGPWTVGFEGHNISHIYGGGKEQLGVAQVYLPINTSADEIPRLKHDPRFGQAVADARLIAAAPDLLEALHLVRVSRGWQYLADESKSLINTAIAKATP